MDMQESVSIVDSLRENHFLLMANDKGNEVYDDDGNLLLYQAENGTCLSVPNTEEVRRLYDLPLNSPEVKDTVSIKELSKPNSLIPITSDENRTVWIGQKSPHSMKATKMLIELFNSPKYQTQMNNPNTIKLKVWEKIAIELQAHGYKIAPSTREAALRTFQKWRNMERTYWKFLKAYEQSGKDPNFRRRKPYFFDDLHPVLTKRAKEAAVEDRSFAAEDGNFRHEEDDDYDGDNDDDEFERKPESEVLKRKRMSGDSHCEAFPRQALALLTSIVTSPKYDERLRDQSLPNKTQVWENICTDLAKEGWRFGTSIKEGAMILSEKWRTVEKTILNKRLSGPRTLYTATLRKAVLMEIEKRKALGPNYSSDPPSPSEFTNPNNRRLKGGEIEPEAVEALLKVIDSGYYQDSFAKFEGKRANIWEKIFDEVESQGFQIAGETKQEKVTRLFQKWRNMKRAFVKYQIAKFKGEEVKKPMFYEMMFKIISQEVLKMDNAECNSDEEINMEMWDEESESGDPIDFLEITHMDHDYGQPEESVVVNPLKLPKIMDVEKINTEAYECSVQTSTQCRPSTSRPSRSHEILSQIKSLQEESLSMQQQNFARIISLLEDQVSQQDILTKAISEYTTSQMNRANMKKNQKNRTFEP